jgi:prophage tail gpP-like protein
VADTLDLATKLARSFGIVARSAVTEVGTVLPLPPITFFLDETCYEIIERVARYTAYLIYEDEYGALVLDRVGTKKMASGFTMPGNIKGASSTLDFRMRFSDYTVVWTTINQFNEINPLGNQRADKADTSVPRYRPKIIVSQQETPDRTYGQKRANWECARRIGRSQAVNLTCDSWRDSAGMLWQPNRLAPINAPALKIVDKEWIIGTVTFRKDQSGTHADLTLMPPDAFDPEPTTLNLWDREIMQSPPPGGASLPPQDGVS